jgi:hypothetical protein
MNFVARHASFAIALRDKTGGGGCCDAGAPVKGARHFAHCALSYALLVPQLGQTRSNRAIVFYFITFTRQ